MFLCEYRKACISNNKGCTLQFSTITCLLKPYPYEYMSSSSILHHDGMSYRTITVCPGQYTTHCPHPYNLCSISQSNTNLVDTGCPCFLRPRRMPRTRCMPLTLTPAPPEYDFYQIRPRNLILYHVDFACDIDIKYNVRSKPPEDIRML